jgi:hypothetical protein
VSVSSSQAQSAKKQNGEKQNCNWLCWLDAVTLCALIIAMCSQINLGDIGRDTTAEGYVTKQLKIALPDIALFVCFAWFVLRTSIERAWQKVWWPPLPCWALIAALLLSILHSRPLVNAVSESLSQADDGFKPMLLALLTKESKEAFAETIQFIGYFLIAPLLFVNLIHDARNALFISRRRLALWSFFGALSLVLLFSTAQLLQGSDAPRALFGSPNAYAGFCAIALPLLLARLTSARVNTPLAIGLSIVAVIAFAITIASFWASLTILFALALVGLLLRAPLRAFVALAVSGVLLILLWPAQANLKAMRRQSYFLMHQSPETNQWQVKKQFVEWQVAIARLSDPREASFATGAGPGNYQFNIGAYYARLPNEKKMPPDSNNLFLVQAVNIGLLGLAALLWMVYRFAQIAFLALKKHHDDWLAAGVLGSLLAWIIINCFHALIVRGTGVMLAFLFALAVVALQRQREPDAIKGEENRNLLADWMS